MEYRHIPNALTLVALSDNNYPQVYLDSLQVVIKQNISVTKSYTLPHNESSIKLIINCCIGLFGLSVLAAEKRTKEIGIRKVLGASVQQIVTALSTDFIKLVAIAPIIATPLVYITADKWLQNYPYRIEMSWWLFTSAGILVILIALFTVSFQSIRTAIANPVKSLRTE